MWQKKIKSNPKTIPAITDDMIIAASAQDNTVCAFSRRDGEQRWVFKAEGGIETSPKIKNGCVFVGSNDKHLYSLKSGDGSLSFSFATGSSVKTAPAFYNGIAVFGSWDRNVYAVNASTGQLLWKFETYDWLHVDPMISGDVALIANMDRSIFALNAETGSLLWSEKLDERPEYRIQIAGENLIVSNFRNMIWALDLKTGKKRWERRCVYEITMFPAALDDKIVYADTSKKITAISLDNGETGHEAEISSALTGSAGITQNDMLCVGENRSLYVICKDFLKILASYPLPQKIIAAPQKINNDLVFIGDDGSLNYLDNFFGKPALAGEETASVRQKGNAESIKKPEIKNVSLSPSIAGLPVSASAQKQPSVAPASLSSADNEPKPVLTMPQNARTEKLAEDDNSIYNEVIRNLSAAVKNLGSRLIKKEYGFSTMIQSFQDKDKEIFIVFKKDNYGDLYIQMFTPLYQMNKTRLLAALRQSVMLSYGSIACATIGKEEFLILSETQLAKSGDTAEFEAILSSLAKRGEDLQSISLAKQKQHYLHSTTPYLEIGEKLLRDVEKNIACSIKKGEKGFEINVGAGDSVKVNMLLDKTDANNNYMITLIALCGQVQYTDEFNLRLLRANTKIPYGGYGIIKNQENMLTVMTDTRILSHTQPVELRKSLLSIYNAVGAFRTGKF